MVSAATRPAAAAAGTRSWGAKKASRGLRTGRGEIRQETPATAGERALPARRVRERRRASTSRSTERRSSPTVSRGTRVVRSAISSTTPSPRRSRSTSNPSAPVPVRSTTSFRGSTSCTDGWARTRRRSRQRAPRKPSIRARNRSASSIAASTRSAPCRSISARAWSRLAWISPEALVVIRASKLASRRSRSTRPRSTACSIAPWEKAVRVLWPLMTTRSAPAVTAQAGRAG